LFGSLAASLVKHVEPVGIGDGWDMHVDSQTITPKSARQVEGGNLADIVGIVVGEDVKLLQSAWGAE